MPVHFVHTEGSEHGLDVLPPSSPQRTAGRWRYSTYQDGLHTLFGRPWPSEELQALWGLVPGSYYIGWNAFKGCFHVESGHDQSRIITAGQGHDLTAWQELFREMELARGV